MKKIFILLLLLFSISFAQNISMSNYNIKVKGKNYKINKNANKNKCWRMVYDGSHVIECFESKGYTFTKNNLYIGKTENDCKKKADKLKLDYSSIWK